MDQVADPHFLPARGADAVFEGRVPAFVAGPSHGQLGSIPVPFVHVVPPHLALRGPGTSVGPEHRIGAPADEREPEVLRVRLPEHGVEGLDQLVEAFELREAAGVAECQRRDVRDALREREGVVVERRAVHLAHRHDRAEPVRVPSQRCDEDGAGVVHEAEVGGDLHRHVLGDHERLGLAEQEVLRDLLGDVRDLRSRFRRMRAHGEHAGDAEGARLLVARVGRGRLTGDDRRDGFDRALEDLSDGVLGGHRLRQPQQRAGDPSFASLGFEQPSRLECNGSMRGQDLEQATIVFVELGESKLRQHDHADDLVARDHGDGEHRFQQVVVGPRDRDGELDLPGVGGEQGGLGERDVPGDPLAEPGHEGGEGLGRVVGEQLTSEGDREQRVTVGLEQVDPAVVVIDDRPELCGDRRRDLLDIAEHVERGRQVVQHVQLGDGPDVVAQPLRFWSRCLCHGSPRRVGDEGMLSRAHPPEAISAVVPRCLNRVGSGASLVEREPTRRNRCPRGRSG